nr:hypothetical protein [uncultured Olsenella sp.]
MLALAGAVLAASFMARQAGARKSAELCSGILSELEKPGGGDASGTVTGKDQDHELPARELLGMDVIGRLSARAVGLDVPVGAVGSDASLVPCQVGSRDGELVVCGSSYQGGIGRIGGLGDGDAVTFTGVDGLVRTYEVASSGTTKSDFDDDFDLLVYYEGAFGERHWVGCSETS